MSVELIPLEGLPEVRPGDDLAALLEPSLAANAASDGDVVAVTQKVVSKAEGRIVPGDDRAAWVDHESVDVVARRGDLVIARTRHGFVCANAGVDASNVAEGFVTLLPEDPDASAEHLQKELSSRLGLSRLGVVITDTFGRAWREGVVDVAIGCAGLPAVVDLRGTRDDRGRELEATVVALADAVAAASGLVMTKTARVPAALVRGLDPAIGDAPPGPARALVRMVADDLFRESALQTLHSRRDIGSFGGGSVDRAIVEEAVAAASAAAVGPELVFVALDSSAAMGRLRAVTDLGAGGPEASILIVPSVRVPDARLSAVLVPAGRSIQNLLLALHAQGVGSVWVEAIDRDAVRAALALGVEWLPLGVVVAGRMPEGGASGPRPPDGTVDRLSWLD